MANINLVEHVVLKAARAVERKPDGLPHPMVVNVVVEHPGLSIVVWVERRNAENDAGGNAQGAENGS
jgi:hypothetical protein